MAEIAQLLQGLAVQLLMIQPVMIQPVMTQAQKVVATLTTSTPYHLGPCGY